MKPRFLCSFKKGSYTYQGFTKSNVRGEVSLIPEGKHISLARVVWLMCSDVWTTSAGRAVGSILCSIAGAGFQVLAVILLGQLIQNDAKLVIQNRLLGMNIPSTLVGEIALIPSSIIIVIFFFVASVLIYLAGLLTLRLAIKFEKEATFKIMKSTISIVQGNPQKPDKAQLREYSKVCTSYPRIVGRALRAGLLLPHFILQALIILVLLLINNASLTLLVLTILGVSFGIQFFINGKGAVLSKKFEDDALKAQKAKKGFLQNAFEEQEMSDKELYSKLNDPLIARSLDSYYRRLIILDETMLVGGLTVGTVVLVLIASIAWFGAESGDFSWAAYFTYIILTVFFLRSAQSAAQLVTFNSRFLHQIKIYYSQTDQAI